MTSTHNKLMSLDANDTKKKKKKGSQNAGFFVVSILLGIIRLYFIFLQRNFSQVNNCVLLGSVVEY
jgi:hypothetical protein